MRSRLAVVGVLAAGLGVTPTYARDPEAPPATPPALGNPAEGDEPAGSNPERARDRFETETRSKSDETLANAVHQQLIDDPRVNAMQVEVHAREGVVRLSGVVGTSDDCRAAEEIAQGVAGVRQVENRLGVAARLDAEPKPGPSAIPER